MLRKTIVLLALWLSLGLAMPATAQPAPASAVELVETFHGHLLQSMKVADRTAPAQRFEALKPFIESGFALVRMARFAAGSAWRKMNDAQQHAYVRAFADVTIATYASRFDAFSGESFATLGTQPGQGKSVLVATEIRRPGKEPVALTYVVYDDQGTPMIADIYLAGSISELGRQRSEYGSVLRSAGADALIRSLREQVQRMLK
jgi:phospholipid transport system substrate-binding protein